MTLDALYLTTNQKTKNHWQAHPDSGKVKPPAYDRQKLAIACGIKPLLPDKVRQLLAELNALAASDPRVDLMPVDSFHLTFLPITLPLYNAHDRPPETDDLQALWQPFRHQPLTVSELRLVALPAQLLLAGIPDAQARVQRDDFSATLLKTRWQEALRARHTNTPLPAPFWHSTLLRYQAEQLPQALRDFFIERESLRFGEISAPLRLNLVNYNWSFQREIGA
ncbi:hypothetical protein GJV06_17050 [Enterobacteriaceae bacterium RIT691]|nr:hypothetical protein [Enterobacteriaceae bacterium RIT691]